MKFYCINLKSRNDKRTFMKKQAKKYKLNIEFHRVTKHQNPVRGCLESHLELIKRAKQNNFPYIAILEDDAKFLVNPKELNIPDDFDMYYLGASVKQQDNNRLIEGWSTHAYILHNRLYDKIIRDLTDYDKEIDRYYVEEIQPNYKCYIASPVMTTQKSGYSDIENRVVNYDEYTTINKEPYQGVKYQIIDDEYRLSLDSVKELPRVSIVTPTRDRHDFVPLMLRNWNAIQYPREKLEWIIVDDGEKPIKALLPEDQAITYVRLETNGALPVGQKRNIGCKHAKGEYIVHMDDDDYYSDLSVELRIRALLSNNAECIGATIIGCMNIISRMCYSIGSTNSVLAEASMAYKRSFWEERNFREDVKTGEAVHFLRGREDRVVQMPYDFILVAFSHRSNITEDLRDSGGAFDALLTCVDIWTQNFVKQYALLHN